MGLMDILNQYRGQTSATPNPNIAQDHFDEVARQAPPEAVGQGVADAFRSDATPPFGEMLGQMFTQSNPAQKAGMLNQLIQSIGPGLLSALGGGILGHAVGQNAGPPSLTPDQAAQLTPAQVQEMASQAERHDPTVMDKIGGYYAEHPQLVKTLGSAALAIALAGVARRIQR